MKIRERNQVFSKNSISSFTYKNKIHEKKINQRMKLFVKDYIQDDGTLFIPESKNEKIIIDLNDDINNNESKNSYFTFNSGSKYEETNAINGNEYSIIEPKNDSTNKKGKKNLIENIDIDLLPIKYDKLWQDIIKDIYNIDSAVNLDDILKNINNDEPVNSYVIFSKHELSKFNFEESIDKFNIRKSEIANKWNNMTDKEKIPYELKSGENCSNYNKNMALINKYLFLGINCFKKKNISEFDFYLLDDIIKDDKNRLKEHMITKAKKKWEIVNNKIKNNYINIKNKILKYLNNLENIEVRTGLDLYIKENFEENKNKEEYEKEWDSLLINKKQIYIQKAYIENIKNEILLNIKEVIKDKIEIKKQFEPLKLFKDDLIELYEINTNDDISELWDNLEENIKELYKIKCHRLNLMIYNKNAMIKKKKDKKNYDKNLNNFLRERKKRNTYSASEKGTTSIKQNIFKEKNNSFKTINKSKTALKRKKKIKKAENKIISPEYKKSKILNKKENNILKNNKIDKINFNSICCEIENIIDQKTNKINNNLDKIVIETKQNHEKKIINNNSEENQNNDNNNINQLQLTNKNILVENEIKINKEFETSNLNYNDSNKGIDIKNRIYQEPEKPIDALERFLVTNKNIIINQYDSNNETNIVEFILKEWRELNPYEKEFYFNQASLDRRLYQFRKMEYKRFSYYDNTKSLEDYENEVQNSIDKIKDELESVFNLDKNTGLLKLKKIENKTNKE